MNCVLVYRGETLKISSCTKIQFNILKKIQKYFCLIPTQTNFWADIWPMMEPNHPVVLLVSRSFPSAPVEYDRYLTETEIVGSWGEMGFCVPNSRCRGKYRIKVLISGFIRCVFIKWLFTYYM